MHLALSPCGLKFLQHHRHLPPAEALLPGAAWRRLVGVRAATLERWEDLPEQRLLQQRGLVEVLPDGPDVAAVETRYRHSPLEHVTRAVLEYTTACNFRCAHCRNAGLAPVTEPRPERLQAAVDVLCALGILRFDFIGGEVTRHGVGWLEVVRHARRHPGVSVEVVSNGWFLEREDFLAAGEVYGSDRAYLRALAEAGVTHVVFSLDGPAPEHDASRRQPGLYARVLRGFRKVRDAGLQPRVSLVLRELVPLQQQEAWLAQVAQALLEPPRPAPDALLAQVLLLDDTNYVSNFIDVGAGSRQRLGLRRWDAIPDEVLRCKNLFRPMPSLRIQASGEVAFCPLVDAGEGAGNLHGRSLVDVLNGMPRGFAYRLHAERRLGAVRGLVDPEVFGTHVDHVCTARAVVTMVARRVHERGVDPQDAAALRAINLEVAHKSGFRPSQE